MSDNSSAFAGDRLAKVIARAGLCSRRDAELWIKEGRVAVNGKVIRTPAFNVTEKDKVRVDGQPLQARQGTRVWLYHKPQGLVVTEKDPEGRTTVFETLEEQGLPRVVSIGRLDINTEGLLLLTNDGGLKRVLELPATGWLRRYRVRAFGSITQAQLDALKDGIEIDGIQYGPIEAVLEREQGSNVWLVLSLREGKNREVKNVLGALGLQVNRLIRVSFGPFQLNDLPIGAVEVVKARILREQLGARLASDAGVDFDSELPEPAAIKLARGAANPALRAAKPGAEPAKQRKGMADRTERFRFADRPDRERSEFDPSKAPLRKDRPGSRSPRRPPRELAKPDFDAGPPRKIFREDGTEAEFTAKTYGKKPKPTGDAPFKKDFGDKPRGDFGDRPKRPFSDKPKGDFGDRPKRPYSPRPGSDAPGGDRPKRPYSPRPGSDAPAGDRPKRPYSARPADGAERPKRSFGDKPPRGDFGDRPKRPYSPRPGSDAPAGDRPKRPYSARPAADGAERPKRSFGDKPPRGDFGDRPKRPYSPRPGSDAPGGDRPKRAFGGKPGGGAPRKDFGDKPKRPRGSGPGGDRPRRPKA
ncbi:MAG: pseudouridine synthase [Hyphomicrobiales bacterium]|nr:MAG: pseudouridine synthase [Hyphomicrobiales bacterium]